LFGAELALLTDSGGAHLRRKESGVAASSATAGENRCALSRMNQIGHHSAIVLRDDGAQRHTHNEVLTVATVAMVTLTVGAVAGRMVRVPAVRQKGCDRGIGLEDHRTAVTT
jgi:hypothetical protein